MQPLIKEVEREVLLEQLKEAELLCGKQQLKDREMNEQLRVVYMTKFGRERRDSSIKIHEPCFTVLAGSSILQSHLIELLKGLKSQLFAESQLVYNQLTVCIGEVTSNKLVYIILQSSVLFL